MINLEQDQLRCLQAILHEHIPAYEVRLFGSRVTNQIKPFSDIDLVVMNAKPLPARQRSLLTFALAESSLRYKVDLVEWCELDEGFRQRIESNFAVVQAL